MTKQNTNWIVVAVIVGVIILVFSSGFNFSNLFVTIPGEPNLDRIIVIPTSISSGQLIEVKYSTSNVPTGKYFVAWEDTLTGGCTPTAIRGSIASETGGMESSIKTITMPQSGSCVINGFYQFANNAQHTLPQITLTVCNRNTPADTDCNGKVSTAELQAYAIKWVSNQIQLNDLQTAAIAWVNS